MTFSSPVTFLIYDISNGKPRCTHIVHIYKRGRLKLNHDWSSLIVGWYLTNPRPDYVLHMETLDDDLTSLLRDVNLLEHKSLFPHTHTQRGGHSSQLADQFLSKLTQQELSQIQDKYKLDFQLFGYLTKRWDSKYLNGGTEGFTGLH